MPYFDEQGAIVGQFFGHRGMAEIYVHVLAGSILFVVSVICITILYRNFGKAGVKWPGIIHGFFYIGLIGFGEFMDHYLYWGPFLSTSLHYLHLAAAPAAIGFFYLGINEYYDKCSHPDKEVHTISNEVAMGVFAGVLTVGIVMGGMAETPLDEALEGPFLMLIVLPLLAVTAVFINTARKIKKSMLAFYFPALGIALSALAIDIWMGRFGDVNRIASLYIAAHALQDLLHVATATIMFLFTLAIVEGIREDILYTCEVTEKSVLKKNKQRKRDFRLDEQ